MPPNSTLSESRGQMEPMRNRCRSKYGHQLSRRQTVQPSTAYTYRVRSEGATGALSSYSSENFSNDSRPTVTASAHLASDGGLSSFIGPLCHGTSTATGVILFSVERRTTKQACIRRLANRPPRARHSMIRALIGSTNAPYLYRMRVQTGAGFSLYSNEVNRDNAPRHFPPLQRIYKRRRPLPAK